MEKSRIILHSLGHALLVVLYVFLVPNILINLGNRFPSGPLVLGMAGGLLLLVISVAIMGILIFGRPILLYIDGNKREAFAFLGWTLGFTALSALIIMFILLSIGQNSIGNIR